MEVWFCDSPYIMQENYCESLIRLQEIFYLYKNEMQDEITDDEPLEFMQEQFETVCYGDFDYLESSCLDIFSQPCVQDIAAIKHRRDGGNLRNSILSHAGIGNFIWKH